MANVGNDVVSSVREQVRDFIVQNFLFGNDSVQFSEEDSFMEKGIIDSTGILELIGFIEESYGIKVEDDELTPDNLDSLRNVGDFIARKQAG